MAGQLLNKRVADVPQRRTQSERRRGSEQGLLSAAIDVIAQHGVGAVTFDAVSSRSGLSRGLATQRFGSKQKMIEALLGHLHDRQREIVARCDDPDLGGMEAIVAYVEYALRDIGLTPQGRTYFMLVSSAVADANELRQAFSAMHRSVETRLIAWIERGQSDGTIRQGIDAASAAMMIGCLIFGVSMQLLVDPEMEMEAVKATSLATIRIALGRAGS